MERKGNGGRVSVSGEKGEWRKGECEWREKGMEER